MDSPSDPSSTTHDEQIDSAVVVLDADDTLFLLREPLSYTYHRILAKHGVSCMRERIAVAAPVVWATLRRLYLAQDNLRPVNAISEREFWRQFASELVQDACGEALSDEAFTEIYDFYARAESRVLRPNAKEFLDWLSQNQVPCVLVTNNDVRIHALVEDLQIRQHFARVFSAAELGVKKPSIEFFRLVTEALKVEPEDVFYLGNDLELDMLPALQYGWRAVWLSDGNSKISTSVPFVRSFSELLELFYES